jgi:hypothetical protein
MIANEENVLVPVVFLLARRARRKRERAKDARKNFVPDSENTRGATVTNHLSRETVSSVELVTRMGRGRFPTTTQARAATPRAKMPKIVIQGKKQSKNVFGGATGKKRATTKSARTLVRRPGVTILLSSVPVDDTSPTFPRPLPVQATASGPDRAFPAPKPPPSSFRRRPVSSTTR